MNSDSVELKPVEYSKADFSSYLASKLNFDNLKCPLCTHDKFGIKTDPNEKLRFTMLPEGTIYEDVDDGYGISPEPAGQSVLVMNCTNCQYLMFFDARSFFNWMKENGRER